MSCKICCQCPCVCQGKDWEGKPFPIISHTKDNLCNQCIHEYPACKSKDIKFEDTTNNIIACYNYRQAILPQLTFLRQANCIAVQKQGKPNPEIIFEIKKDGTLRRCGRMSKDLGFKCDEEGKIVVR